MKIYQIYYDDHSRSKLNDCFTPYDNTQGNPDEFEYGVMRRLFVEHDFDKHSHLGVVSWKFFDKQLENHQKPTNFKPEHFVEVCEKYKDEYDVIHMNPFSWTGSNVWIQGEISHGNRFLEYVISCFHYVGLDHRLLHVQVDYDTMCYCNYWVGNQKFWKLYMAITDRVFRACREQPRLDKKGIILTPYIVERMVMLVMSAYYDDLKILPLGLSSPNKFCVAPKNTNDLSRYLTTK